MSAQLQLVVDNTRPHDARARAIVDQIMRDIRPILDRRFHRGAPKEASVIPLHILDELEAYHRQGRPPGDFLQAVLKNDLAQAVLRVDPNASPFLRELVVHAWENLPTESIGSPSRVQRWMDNGGLEGLPADLDSQADGHKPEPAKADHDDDDETIGGSVRW